MDRNDIADILGTLDAQSGFLCEIRDLLAARLPVPVEDLPAPTSESKLDKMRQSNAALRKENADLRAELESVTRRETEGVALFDKLLAEERAKVANLQHSVNELAALKAADKPGRWVVRDVFNGSCRDMLRWHASAKGCSTPWPSYNLASEFIRAFHHVGCEVINLDDHKETP